MAWTRPPLRTTGTLITASNWNTDLADNLQWLYDFTSINPYVPVLTASGAVPSLGNGSLAGRYARIGTKLVSFSMGFTAGSTTNFGSGQLQFTLPLAAADTSGVFAASFANAGVQNYVGSGFVIGPLTSFAITFTGDTGAGVTATNPFTWGVNDTLRASCEYFIL